MNDSEGIAKLAKAGADLSKPHKLEFFLRFPSEDAAATASYRLEELAFKPVTEKDDSQGDWVIIATKNMYPVETDLAGLRAKLDAVAKEGGGNYEGWRAAN